MKNEIQNNDIILPGNLGTVNDMPITQVFKGEHVTIITVTPEPKLSDIEGEEFFISITRPKQIET